MSFHPSVYHAQFTLKVIATKFSANLYIVNPFTCGVQHYFMASSEGELPIQLEEGCTFLLSECGRVGYQIKRIN